MPRQIDVLRRVQDVRRHLDAVVNELLTDTDRALIAAEDAHNLAGDLADFIAGTGDYASTTDKEG